MVEVEKGCVAIGAHRGSARPLGGDKEVAEIGRRR
jgi:hypothetical protein